MDKKADAWKNFQDEMKDKRTSRKTPTLRHFLLVFLLVAQGLLWSWWGFFLRWSNRICHTDLEQSVRGVLQKSCYATRVNILEKHM